MYHPMVGGCAVAQFFLVFGFWFFVFGFWFFARIDPLLSMLRRSYWVSAAAAGAGGG